MEHTYSFGYWLRRQRKALDLTQAALAQRVGCAIVTVKRIEADTRRPSQAMAERLADILRVAPNERPLFLAAARAERSVAALTLPDTPIAQAAPDSAPQRKQVTVLQARLLGLEFLIEREQPMVVAEQLTALWRALEAVIARHGGRILSGSESQLVAGWGIDTIHERAAEQAVRAAVALQAAVEATSTNRLLSLRIGISTGLALVQGENVVGEPVVQSGRLVALNQQPVLLITHATYAQVRQVVEYAQHEPLVLADQPPTALYAILAVRSVAHTGLLGMDRRYRTPLIGRDTERTQLEAIWAAVVERQEGRLISVVADAGVGKTRLVAEFVRWVQRSWPAARVWHGRATPQTYLQPYAVLRDLFSHAWAISERDDAMQVVAKVAQALAAGRQHGDDGTGAAPLLAHFLGFARASTDPAHVVEDARQLHAQGLHLLRAYLGALAVQQPLLLVVEDLHWADAASLDALAGLHDVVQQTSICFICTARPHFVTEHPHWCATPNHQRLELEPLAATESQRLVTALLQTSTVPDTLQSLVVERADGNPFYIEELIGMLVDAQVVSPRAPQATVDLMRLAQTQLPTTLRGVLQARLEALAPNELALLQQAAVLGRTFWDEALVRLGTADDAARRELRDIQQTLATVQQRGLVFQRAQSRIATAREYAFSHALLRDVAYERVVQHRRQQFHLNAARWLEALAATGRRADEYAAEIAAHYDAGSDAVRAVTWYVRAATTATAHYANQPGIAALSRALELVAPDDLALRYRLVYQREGLYDLSAERALQLRELHTLVDLAAQLDDTRRAEVALRQSRYARMHSEYETAIIMATRAQKWAEAAGNIVLEAQACFVLARTLYALGHIAEVPAQLERAYALAQIAGQWQTQALCLWIRGRMATDRQRMVEAEAHFAQMLRVCQAHDLHTFACDALSALGHISWMQAAFARAEQYYREEYALARRIGDRLHECLALFGLGHYWMATGDYVQTRHYLQQSLDLAHVSDNHEQAAISWAYLALISLHEADYVAAQRGAHQALSVGGTSDQTRALALTVYAHCLTALGQRDAAEEHYTVALALFHKLDKPSFAAEVAAGLARVALQQGNPGGALQHLDSILNQVLANALFVEANDPLWIVWTCYSVLEACGDSRAASLLERSYWQLQARAAQFPQVEQQRACLEQIPYHRALVRAWQTTNLLDTSSSV